MASAAEGPARALRGDDHGAWLGRGRHCSLRRACCATAGALAVSIVAFISWPRSGSAPIPECPAPETGRISVELLPAKTDREDQRCSQKQPSLFSKILLDVTRTCSTPQPMSQEDCQLTYHTAWMYLDAGHEIDVDLNFTGPGSEPAAGRWDFFQVAAILRQNGCDAELQLSRYKSAECLEGNASQPNFRVSVDPLGRRPASAMTQLTCRRQLGPEASPEPQVHLADTFASGKPCPQSEEAPEILRAARVVIA